MPVRSRHLRGWRCSRLFNSLLSTRIRVEHEDNANTMGQLAGRNLAGEREAYHHLRFFYSDLFEFSYAAVGELDSRLQIVTDLTEQNRLGAIHFQQSQVLGADCRTGTCLNLKDLGKRFPLG